ncbi:MAG: hypothetical protein U1C33_05395, partial [Candidatus Cloacimonadaceae bacterium]|nr:hypothetical protein [Candidatus Cloacimonadaceae bacterium]
SQVGNNAFGCVFLDMQIQNRDYLATVIKGIKSINKDVLLVLATDFLSEVDKEKYKKMGINVALEKPFHIKDIRKVFQSFGGKLPTAQ